MSKHFTNIISNLFGRFASAKFATPIQKIINNSYVKFLGLDMSEFDKPSSYDSLNALFTRELKRAREIDSDPKSVISPCDSFITEMGKIEEKRAYQIKGMSYDLAPLLGVEYQKEIDSLEGGEFVNFYLSPKDYHRYHIPFDLKVESLTYIPAKLYPVNIPFLKKKVNLFIENERVVIATRDNYDKRHFLVLVGALNVGKMVVTFEKQVQTNSSTKSPKYFNYQEPIYLKKGECFGYFKMGSTILMFSQKESISYDVSQGQSVKFAQVIGRLKGE
jgi:phosphatidylserine decarboxylase